MPRRRAAAAVLLCSALATGVAACSSGSTPSAAPASSAAASSSAPASSAAPSSGAGTTSTQTACTGIAAGRQNASQVVTTTRTKPVLRPAVALVLLSVRDAAAGATSAPAPAGPAFAELVAAIDDLDAQAGAALPADADPVRTPVTVDPSRLEAALAGVDAVCPPAG